MANSFPTGWFYPLFVGGPSGVPAIVVPAAASVVRHVLTRADAMIAVQTAGAPSYEPLVTVLDGVSLIANPLLAVIVDGTVGSADRDEWDGLLMGSQGQSMTISWNAAVPAGITMFIRAWGYDL